MDPDNLEEIVDDVASDVELAVYPSGNDYYTLPDEQLDEQGAQSTFDASFLFISG